jgi:molybdopterin converting factor small subunit
MRVTVEYLAQLKRAAGCAAEQVDFGGGTLAELLRQVGDRHDDAFRSLLLTAELQPQKSLLFFVGEEPAALDRPLRDGERVTILAPMAGG